MARKRTLIAVVLVVVVAAIGSAWALGILGKPRVESVQNHFGTVSNETTTVETNLTVANPNPIGVQLGGVSVNYTVAMNDVAIASGTKDGIGLDRGNTTLPFTTGMRNDRIPAWWYTHIRKGERTAVTVEARVRSSTLGQSVSLTQGETIETDIISQFNSTETRPVNASQPLISDPVLYINETRAAWDRDNLTRSATPMDMGFTVYNPKPFPYTVSKIGYTISMNDVTVGAGETDRGYLIAPGEAQTIGARTAIQNDNLDEWWLTHLRRNQVTELYIDFYLVLEGGGEQFRIDLDSIDYRRTIETDIFGNKAAYPTGDRSSSSGERGASDGSETPTPTPTSTPADDGLLGGPEPPETVTESPTETATETEDGTLSDPTTTETPLDTPSPTESATETPSESPTETDDGILL